MQNFNFNIVKGLCDIWLQCGKVFKIPKLFDHAKPNSNYVNKTTPRKFQIRISMKANCINSLRELIGLVRFYKVIGLYIYIYIYIYIYRVGYIISYGQKRNDFRNHFTTLGTCKFRIRIWRESKSAKSCCFSLSLIRLPVIDIITSH